MKPETTPEKLNSRWRKLFPNQVPDLISVADPLEGNEIDLEGSKLFVVRVGHTDTDDTTCLHVPSIGLVVAGDAVYTGIHPFLNESNRQTRRDWIAARGRRPPSQGWKTFLHNHANGIAAMDLFVVPTVSVTILASCTHFR